MSQSAARAMAMTLLHEAAQSIVAAQRVLSSAAVISSGDQVSRELLETVCRVTGLVQQLHAQTPADPPSASVQR